MAHAYCVAVDVGTSRVAAASASAGQNTAPVTALFPLGRNADSAPAVAFIGAADEVLLGDAAERRGLAEPERLVREFKRSVGDDVPFLVAGSERSAQDLFACTVRSVLDAVSQHEGGEAATVVLTHPVAWGPHRLGLVRDALALAGVDQVATISEPEAAARHYDLTHEIEVGKVVIVYDLGGGTFDLAALRKGEDGSLDIVGTPVGLDDLGGADFDDAVIRHVIRSTQLADAATADDEPARLALAHLRRECVEAKEALSFDAEATIPVLVPPHRTSIRLTRAEFESMIAPALDRTVQAVDDLLESAGVSHDEVAAIVLVGGSSRIPLVTQTLSERFAAPIAVDTDPKASMALGAARWGLDRAAAAATAEAESASDADLAPTMHTQDAPDAAEARGTGTPTTEEDAQPGERRWYAAAMIAGAAVIAGGIIFGGSVAAGLRPVDVDRFASSTGGGSETGTTDTADSDPRSPLWARDAFSAGQAAADAATMQPAARGSSASTRSLSAPAVLPRIGQSAPLVTSNSAAAASTSSTPKQPAPTAAPKPKPTPSTPAPSAPAGQTPTTTPTPTTPSEPAPSPTPSVSEPEPTPPPVEPVPDPVPAPATEPPPVTPASEPEPAVP